MKTFLSIVAAFALVGCDLKVESPDMDILNQVVRKLKADPKDISDSDVASMRESMEDLAREEYGTRAGLSELYHRALSATGLSRPDLKRIFVDTKISRWSTSEVHNGTYRQLTQTKLLVYVKAKEDRRSRSEIVDSGSFDDLRYAFAVDTVCNAFKNRSENRERNETPTSTVCKIVDFDFVSPEPGE